MCIRGTRDRRLISKGIVDADVPGAAPAPVENAVRPAPVRDLPVRPTVTAQPPAAITPSFIPVAKSVEEYLNIVAELSPEGIQRETENPRRLLMASHVHKSKKLDIAYAPFDHVNVGADVVIVGITPGKQQMEAALLAANRALASGATHAEALARAKVHASFVGPMRLNLVKMMDAVGINGWLGIETTASLWGKDSDRAHFTSAIRYPTFVNGENYSRSPDMNDVPFLFDKSRKWLKEELELFPNAIFVPMGDMVSMVLERLGRELRIEPERVLTLMPHAAGSNNGPISRFLGGKGENDDWRRRFRMISEKVASLAPPSSGTRP